MAEYRDFLAAQRFQRFVAISADGAHVAYATDTSGQFNLWTQPVSGGPARQLTSFTRQSVRSAAWSPHGTLIAFTADTGGDEQTQVFTVPAAGGKARKLSGTSDSQFMIAEKTAFDPSGRYLLCGGNDHDPGNPGLIVYDLHGGPEIRSGGPEARHHLPGRAVTRRAARGGRNLHHERGLPLLLG